MQVCTHLIVFFNKNNKNNNYNFIRQNNGYNDLFVNLIKIIIEYNKIKDINFETINYKQNDFRNPYPNIDIEDKYIIKDYIDILKNNPNIIKDQDLKYIYPNLNKQITNLKLTTVSNMSIYPHPIVLKSASNKIKQN